ncbi:SDR family NAD(P)-dependent oxidoreductase, partial [Listeria monocytogenes]|nr:SDR family NAD(P)-dependent oxidoreductase [Listeria monocytogenes]
MTNKRVAFILGGSGGIGKAVVQKLVEQNFAVVVHYSGNKAKAEALVENIVKSGGEAISVGGDVADEAQMIRAFDFIESQFGGIDVVVNTAGIMKLSPIATLDMDEFDLIQRT